MPSPAEHAATIRDGLLEFCNETYWEDDVQPNPLVALAALVTQAEQADCGGVNCGKCQQCLTVHEYFLKQACDDKKVKLEAAEARADQLQRDLDAAIEALAGCQSGLYSIREIADRAIRKGYLHEDAWESVYDLAALAEDTP